MPKPKMINLSGHWTGFYSHHDNPRPITAHLSQNGDSLFGTMNDEVTDFDDSVSELAMEEGLPPGADEQIVEKIRSICPEAPLEPVRAAFHLPSDSTVEGEVQGRAVLFRKTYQGQYFAGFRIGEIRVGKLGEDQEVQYLGTLSPDGNEIQGRWQVLDEDDVPLQRSSGSFVLRRAEPHEN
ncbi:hypothetical protein BH23PLA1_BH23PLA1_28710 [soil metagenome]